MSFVHFIFGWAGLSTLIGIGAVVVAVLLPAPLAAIIPGLRALAINVALGALGFSFVYGWGYADHAKYSKAQIERQIKNAVDKGEHARADALRRFDSDPDGVRDDGFQRP